MREVSSERLNKDARRVIEHPFWITGLKPGACYSRTHDDHDGTRTGTISIIIDEQGDAWVAFQPPENQLGRMLRFRTWGGGGNSLRVRNALMVLAEAIRLDEEERPQHSQ